MEEANQSDKNLKLLNDIHTRVSFFEDQIDAVREQIEALEEKLQKIFWFIEFHLGEIPQKYRKVLPKKGEYPYFTTKNKDIPELNKVSELEIPKDSEVLQTAKDRMLKLSEKGWPKRVNAEAFLASWELRESQQADKQNESSPSSQESPDHKNPPSQT